MQQIRIDYTFVLDPKGGAKCLTYDVSDVRGRTLHAVNFGSPDRGTITVDIPEHDPRDGLVRDLFVSMVTSRGLKPAEFALQAPMLLDLATEVAEFMLKKGLRS